VTHPSLGRPPASPSAGHSAAAATLRAASGRLAARALEAFVADVPDARDRYDDVALRRLLRDLATILDQVATALATSHRDEFIAWCEALVPGYRKRNVPMDDLVRLMDELKRASAAALEPAPASVAGALLDDAAKAFKAHRRIGGDASKKNPVVHFIYKGA
jgi:hypothetical protein